MSKNALSAALAIVLLGLTSAAFAHLPDKVFGAFQWPTNQLPTLDGDISEWEAVVPAELWIDINRDHTDTVLGGKAVDTADLFFRYAVGWNDELDRIYFVHDRFDDLYDRTGDKDDTIEIGWDADHSGGNFWHDNDEVQEDQWRKMGQQAQSGHFAWPALGTGEGQNSWFWFWMTDLGPGVQWPDDEPYACCADSFTLEGGQDAETSLQAEWYVTGWDDYNYSGPDQSVQHDFVEGEIVGIGFAVHDTDEVTVDENGDEVPSFTKYVLGGENLIFGDASFFSDFQLLPVCADCLPTAVENDSWGRVKASFAP